MASTKPTTQPAAPQTKCPLCGAASTIIDGHLACPTEFCPWDGGAVAMTNQTPAPQWTPGPLAVKRRSLIYQPETHVADVGEDFRIVASRFVRPEEHGANAVLFAAAPELYAALQLALERLTEWAGTDGAYPWDQRVLREAHAALAKARGGQP